MTMTDIEVEDVQFSHTWLDEPDDEKGERCAWTDIVLKIRNRSSRVTYYVRANVCTVQYEANSGKLQLGFVEPPPDENLRTTYYREPLLIPVLPGATVVIQESVPVQLKGLEVTPEGKLAMKMVDISGTKRVTVMLAHHTTPFRCVHTQSIYETRRQLNAWGDCVEHTVDRCLPALVSQKQVPEDDPNRRPTTE